MLEISAPYELPALLEEILERAVRLVKAPKGSLFLADPGKRELRCVAVYGYKGQEADLVLRYGQGASGRVAESGQPLVIQDYPAWPGKLQEPTEIQEITALVSVPMLWQGQVSGVINVAETRPGHSFTPEEVELLASYGRQNAILLENARLYQAERQRAQLIETLLKISETIGSTLDADRIFDEIASAARLLLPVEQVVILLWDEAKARLYPALPKPGSSSQAKLSKRQIKRFSQLSFSPEEVPLVRLLLENGAPVAITDARSSDLLPRKWVRYFGSRSVLAAPFAIQGHFSGVLYLDRSSRMHSFTASEIDLACALARQTGLAIERARLFEAAQQRARGAETLRQATAAVTSTLRQEEAVERILEQLATVVPYDSASVQLLQNGYLEIVGGRGWPDPQAILGMRFPIPGDNPNTRVILEQKPLIIDDPATGYEAFKEATHRRIRSWLGVPLIVQERVIGMVSIDSYSKHYFTPEHLHIASAFADQVAIAIENTRLYTEERQRANELDALQATIADITSELELPNLLRDILERAVNLMNATGGDLGIFNEAEQILLIVTSYNMNKDYSGTRMELGEGLMGQVSLTLEPLIIADYQSWPGKSHQYLEETWKAAIVVPLQMGGKLLGAIGVVDSAEERTFTPSDLRLLTLFAQQASIAIQNARLYQATKEAAERRAILHRASQAIVAASLDPEGIYFAIHEAASQLMPSEAFVIALMNEASDTIEAVYLVDRAGRTPTITLPAGAGLSGYIIKTGKSLYIEDIDEYEGIESVRFGDNQDVRSILAVPMILRKEVVGMLSVQTYQPKAYTSEDLYLLEMLAAHAAIAIDNTRLFQEVQQLAITDPLTGANNRRELYEQGEREFARSKRYKHSLSAMMVDIDKFKVINDSYGHTTGDQILTQLTGRIRANIRDIDILGRYGGDEFAILLPETGLEAALGVAERLRAAIAGSPFQTEAGLIHITASIGVSTLSGDLASLESLIGKADKGAYKAKEAGQDSVQVA
jgi:two-component system cell cycle response regulator